jgi:hypothetical protein
MLMNMGMIPAGRDLLRTVDVIVMAVVVPMAVIVNQSWMFMLVQVPLAQEQGSSHDHESAS